LNSANNDRIASVSNKNVETLEIMWTNYVSAKQAWHSRCCFEFIFWCAFSRSLTITWLKQIASVFRKKSAASADGVT